MCDNNDLAKTMLIHAAVTVFSAALCVGLVAIGTHSLHSMWGLLILLAGGTYRYKAK